MNVRLFHLHKGASMHCLSFIIPECCLFRVKNGPRPDGELHSFFPYCYKRGAVSIRSTICQHLSVSKDIYVFLLDSRDIREVSQYFSFLLPQITYKWTWSVIQHSEACLDGHLRRVTRLLAFTLKLNESLPLLGGDRELHAKLVLDLNLCWSFCVEPACPAFRLGTAMQ